MPPKDKVHTTVTGALERFGKVFDSCDLLVAFYQVKPDVGYPVETMIALAEQERVFAVKEGNDSPETSEMDTRAMCAADSEIAIWSTHSRSSLSDLTIMGADGILSGMGASALTFTLHSVGPFGPAISSKLEKCATSFTA